MKKAGRASEVDAFISQRYMDPQGRVVIVVKEPGGERWGSFRQVNQDGTVLLRQVKTPLLPLVAKAELAAKHLYAYARVKGWAYIPTPVHLENLLCLVMKPCPAATVIETWADEDRVLAAGWAVALHLQASDNHVRVPPVPWVIKAWEMRKAVA